jgi:hypothetical protein
MKTIGLVLVLLGVTMFLGIPLVSIVGGSILGLAGGVLGLAGGIVGAVFGIVAGVMGGMFGIVTGMIGALFGLGVGLVAVALPILIVVGLIVGLVKLVALA